MSTAIAMFIMLSTCITEGRTEFVCVFSSYMMHRDFVDDCVLCFISSIVSDHIDCDKYLLEFYKEYKRIIMSIRTMKLNMELEEDFRKLLKLEEDFRKLFNCTSRVFEKLDNRNSYRT